MVPLLIEEADIASTGAAVEANQEYDNWVASLLSPRSELSRVMLSAIETSSRSLNAEVVPGTGAALSSGRK